MESLGRGTASAQRPPDDWTRTTRSMTCERSSLCSSGASIRVLVGAPPKQYDGSAWSATTPASRLQRVALSLSDNLCALLAAW